ncbi:MAG: UMP kinase [Candidatus Gribaldobacteria bacterium]|nr:UMP kinase [Candidatus Gribaldobacteria bacterium]
MEQFVISLGGSVAFDNGPNLDFLKGFCAVLKEEVQKGNKFVIVVGGGLVWIGIYATRLNAQLLVAILKSLEIATKFNDNLDLAEFGQNSIIVGGGGVPGHSSDFTTVQMAVNFKIKKVINLGKPDYVYTANPDKDPTAKPIEKIAWTDYFKIIPTEWIPGMNVPFDALAAHLALENNVEVVVATGKDLSNFQSILRNGDFKGTRMYGK